MQKYILAAFVRRDEFVTAHVIELKYPNCSQMAGRNGPQCDELPEGAVRPTRRRS